MYNFFNSKFYDFELTRLLGTTGAGGCEIAEFLEAVGKLKRHDPESWYAVWNEQSHRAEVVAREAADLGYQKSALRAFLRAGNYARASGYMFTGPDARVLESSERSTSLFHESFEYMDGQVIPVSIPYDEAKGDIFIHGYLYLPPDSRRLPDGQKTPVVLNCCGADSTQEELYFGLINVGLELGYAVFTFEGPGQGMMLKRDKQPMRPDYEVITSRVLDRLEHMAKKSPELGLDVNRFVAAGASMGAFYSLRSCVDKRIKACVAIDGFFSLWALALERMPKWYSSMWLSGWLPESVFNLSILFGMAMDFSTRWEFGLGMTMMGMATPGDTLRRFRAFSLDVARDGRVVDRIQCPVMLTGASHPLYATAQDGTIAVAKALTGVPEHLKEIWIPEEIGNGGLTGKVGAWALLSQKSFAFLDKHLGVQR